MAFFGWEFCSDERTGTDGLENTNLHRGPNGAWRPPTSFSEPERGDVIIFPYPDDESQDYVKRCRASRNEVEIRAGKLIPLTSLENRPLLKEEPCSDGPFEVPEKACFAMGDNRNSSLDSLGIGRTNFVHREDIIGKVL